MPLQATSGAASYDGFGGGAAAVPTYIEDVFSTYLYTGNGTSQTITNGIDLAGKGGMVWLKTRNQAYGNTLYDTTRGVNTILRSEANNAQQFSANTLTSFNANGFTIGANEDSNFSTSNNAVSWTFREKPKFFDITTFTASAASPTVTFNHNLGSTPGCVFIKSSVITAGSLSTTTDAWYVWHRSLSPSTANLVLNTTAAQNNGSVFGSITDTQITFTGTFASSNSRTFVAYIFAHNAGGFGLTGTDNVISCGSFTTDASGNASVTLGYEPQWVLFKKTSAVGPWYLVDNMRAFSRTTVNYLNPNNTGIDTEVTAADALFPTATGFGGTSAFLDLSSTYIYIAIRRGPMKVPTSGTSVFTPALATSNGTSATFTTNFPVDLAMFRSRGLDGSSFNVMDRLRGATPDLRTAATAAESSANSSFDLMTTWAELTGYSNGTTEVLEAFRRAPSFFDEVCYTGTGANATWSHNLGAVPEMMIVKKRGGVANWAVYHSALGAAGYAILNTTAASTTSSTFWQSTTPTATSFYTGTNGNVGDSGLTYVAYLFATCAGVSKVGSYTGNGSTQTINCGFTGGARFVLIKRTDSTGDWYVYDTARGMTTLTDPYLLMNSSAAESATLGSVTTVSTGFAVNASILAAINTNAASYIFLAIA